MSNTQETKIFLCYARQDAARVELLYQKLLTAGFRPWIDIKDILPGEPWELVLEKAIKEASFFLACLSKNSVYKRGIIQKEIKEALDVWQQKLDSDIYLIPVRLENCNVPEVLSRFQWVDFFATDGFERLLKAITAGIERFKKEQSDFITNIDKATSSEEQLSNADAELLFRKGLEILEKQFGEIHPNVAASIENLATLLKAKKKYDEAEKLFRKALEIRERLLGKEHPEVAINLNNLIALFRIQGKYADAEPLILRARAILEKEKKLALSGDTYSIRYISSDNWFLEWAIDWDFNIKGQWARSGRDNSGTAWHTELGLDEDAHRALLEHFGLIDWIDEYPIDRVIYLSPRELATERRLKEVKYQLPSHYMNSGTMGYSAQAQDARDHRLK